MDIGIIVGVAGMISSAIGIGISIVTRDWITAMWAGASLFWALAYTLAKML